MSSVTLLVRPKTAIELTVALAEVEPLGWRRIVVPGEMNLAMLHRILQMAMG